jgi:transcriptional regulator with GAF, ATPase, and Fis domain
MIRDAAPSDALSMSPKHLIVKLILVNLLFITYLFHRENRERLLRNTWQSALERSLTRLRSRHDQMAGMLSMVRIESEGPDASVFEPFIRISCYMFPCDQASLMVLDPARRYLELRSASGHPDRGQILGSRQRVGHGIAGKVAEHGKGLLLGPTVEEKNFRKLNPRSYTISAAMVVPVTYGNSLVGVMSVSSRSPGVIYSEDDLHILQTFAKAAGAHCWQAQQALTTAAAPDSGRVELA